MPARDRSNRSINGALMVNSAEKHPHGASIPMSRRQ